MSKIEQGHPWANKLYEWANIDKDVILGIIASSVANQTVPSPHESQFTYQQCEQVLAYAVYMLDKQNLKQSFRLQKSVSHSIYWMIYILMVPTTSLAKQLLKPRNLSAHYHLYSPMFSDKKYQY